jgi:CAAX prenyl protease-like protein
MSFLRNQLAASPTRARVVPFVLFVVLTFCQGHFGEEPRYWLYLAKTIVGAWMIWEMWPLVTEMRWAVSAEAIGVGVGVFVMWVGLDRFYPKLSRPIAPWNPHAQFGHNSALAWVFIYGRILGSSLVVPPLEETFYRSFIYRYLIKSDFLTVPLNQLRWLPLLMTAALFGFSHYEWLAGILCGLAYHWLVIRKNRLGDAMTAHAITNLLLGLWAVWRGDWHFW